MTPDEIQWYDHRGNRITSGENFTFLEGNTRLIIQNLEVYDNGYYKAVVSRSSLPANATTGFRLEITGISSLEPLYMDQEEMELFLSSPYTSCRCT